MAILTVGSKAQGAMTTEGNSCVSTCPPTPSPGSRLVYLSWALSGGALAARC